jgi:hypothetical protein
MWTALRRHGHGSEHPTADNAPYTVEPQPRHHERVTDGTDESERNLRRRSQIHRRIRFIKSSLRQVHW